jgi:hypothetical protein
MHWRSDRSPVKRTGPSVRERLDDPDKRRMALAAELAEIARQERRLP